MLLTNFDSKVLIQEYSPLSGETESTIEVAFGDSSLSSQIKGKCKQTSKGLAAVYGDGGHLYLQINTHKWNLGHKNTKLNYTTLNDALFKVEDKNSSFEIRYPYWMKDALISDLDDTDSDHDFFAYVIWLCEPENYARLAKKWSNSGIRVVPS